MEKAIQPDFKIIFESAPGLNLILLPDLCIIAVSEAYLQATMTKRTDIIGHHLFEIFPDNPEDVGATGVSNLRFSLNYVLEHKVAHTMAVQKYDIRRPDGTFEERFWSPINKPVLNSHNEVEYIIHRVEDVTEFILIKREQQEKEGSLSFLQQQIEKMEMEIYKRAQEIQQINEQLLTEIKLRKKAEKELLDINSVLDLKVLERTNEILKATNTLSQTFERITDAFVAVDKNWCYTYVNSKAEQMLNKPHGHLVGKHMWTEFPEAINNLAYKAYYKAMEKQEYIQLEEYYYPACVWLEIHIYPSPEGLSIFFKDITDKKKAEEALSRNHAFIESIINASPDIIYTYDIEERKNIYVNEGIQTNLGYTNADLKEMGDQLIPTLMHPEDFQYYLYNTYPKYSTAKDKEIITHEYRMRNSKGNWQWLYCKESIFLRKPDGTPKQIFGIVTNITEQKKAEEEIARVYQEMGIALNRITDSIVSVDSEWRYTFLNDAAMTTHPLGREETMGKIIWDVHPELSKTIFGEKFKAVMQTQVAAEFENYYPPFNIWVNMKVYPSANGLTMYYEDITDRKKAEEKIKASEEKYRNLVEQASDGIVQVNEDREIILVNTSLCRMLGYTEAELLQLKIEDTYSTKEKVLARQRQQAAKEKGSLSFERKMIKKDGTEIAVEIGLSKTATGQLLGIVRDITERKKISEALAKSENYLRTILQTEPECVKVLGLKGELLSMNPAGLAMIEADNDEQVLGRQMTELVNEKYRVAFNRLTKDIFNGNSGALEFEITGLKGTPRWLETHAVPLKDAEGRIISLLGVTRDITERKKSEQLIKEKSEQLQTLSDNLPGAMMYQLLRDADGKMSFTYLSKSVEHFTGHSPEEVIQNPALLYTITNEEDRQITAAAEKISFRDMSIFNIEVRCKNLNGGQGWVHIRSIPRKLADGRVIWDGIMTDISDRKKAEQAIKESEEKYRTLVEQASDAIFIADSTGRFITVNTSACKLAQYSETELLKMSIYDLADSEDIQKNPYHFDELKKGKTVRTERRMRGKEGILLQVEIIAKLLSDGRLLAFVRDISERIKTQNEVIKEKNLSDSIINSLPGVFFLYNKDRKFLRWNKNFEVVTKYNFNEIKIMHLLDLFDEDEKELVSQKISNVFEYGEDNMQAKFLLKTKEKISYYFTGKLIDYEGTPCLMGIGIDFSELVMAQEKITETTTQLRQLTAHLQTIREEERKRIGREIHDELGQQLTAIKMDVAWIDKKTADKESIVKTKLKNIINLLDGSNLSIKKILNELRLGILDDQNLLDVLEWQGSQFTESTGIPVKFTSAIESIKLKEDIATCIFRVYQESLTNIMRYSEASTVQTNFNADNGYIFFTVEDNGKGFDIKSLQNRKSFGILGMKERVLSAYGTFDLTSTPGRGTKIILKLPYNTSAERKTE